MNKYEAMIITKPNLTESQREELKEKITKKMDSLKGKVLSYTVWRDQSKFTFPIKERGSGGKKFFEGTYLLLNFELSPDKIAGMKDLFRLQESILRNIILRSGD